MIKSLTRINELAKKQREEGLTVGEKFEQSLLRQEYLSEIRGQILNSLEGLTVIDSLGNDVTPEKVRNIRERS